MKQSQQSAGSSASETEAPPPMSDDKPSPASNDAEAVLAALKNLGSANYAALAKATGLSKIAVSAAITELRKTGLVNSESGGKYSAAESNKTTPTAKKSTGSKVAETEEPPPPPPPPPESSEDKPQPSTKPATTSGDDDTVTVLGALKDLGAGNYAALAQATGLSKIAVSAAITELRKGGLVNSESGGKYSAANGETKPTTKKSTGSKAAKPKASPASTEKPKPAASSAGSDADVVLAALKGLGNANYAALAQTTGLSKIAVSAAITDLSKRGLVNSQPGGKYSPAGAAPQQIEAAPATGSAATPPTGSLATELEKLAALRESGALTAAEYTKAKKKLLDEN